MPLNTAHAFVLRTYNFAEADKVCVLLTQREGKIRGVAHGARKMKSRFGSALEPLTEVSVTYFSQEGRDLVSISNAEIVRSHFNSASSAVEVAAAMSYFADLLVEFLPDAEPNEAAYRLVRAALGALGEALDPFVVARYFEVWLLRLSGFYPDLKRCAVCGAPSGQDGPVWLTNEGVPRCQDCSGGRGVRVGPGLRSTLARALAEPPDRFAASPPPKDHLTRLAEINYAIIRHTLERDLRSHALFHRLSREAGAEDRAGKAGAY
jgi:DNA repair protein RecO (recombination protein O)